MTMYTADKMSNAQYHATDAISSSAVKTVHGKSLAHWKARGEFKGSTIFDVGSVVHDSVLEGGQNSIRGPEDRRGNAWKIAYAEAQAAGKTLLTASDYDIARRVADGVLFHPVGQIIAGNDTVNEASFFAVDHDTGLELKCRPDSYWMSQGVIYDIKTCQDASPRGVAKDFQSYGYPLQAAFYMKVLRLAGFKATKFVFVHVEKTAPYAVSVNELSPEYLEWAEGQVDLTLVRIAEASLNGDYSTGWPTVTTIDLPRWLQADDFSN